MLLNLSNSPSDDPSTLATTSRDLQPNLPRGAWRAPGYEILDTRNTEIGRVTLLRHATSGATVIAIEDQQILHSFMAAVPTRIADDSGIAHVLEHMALFRSRSAKGAADSFSDMRFSGYKTDVSAATVPDCTVYPVASPLKGEMYKLASAYLTRLLAPKYTQEDFELEAWHVALKQHGVNVVPQYGGVIYNEVRDYFSDPDWHSIHLLDTHLFPDTHYKFDHGGLPLEVLRLGVPDLQAYWKLNYQPSRMLFLVRQPENVVDALALLHKGLTPFPSNGLVIPAEPQSPFTSPREAIAPYPYFGESLEEAPRFIQLAWAFPPVTSLDRYARLELLADALLGHDGSPLKRELSVRFPKATVDSRLDTTTRQPYISLSIEGIDVSQAHEVRRVVYDELRKIAHEGLDPQLLRYVRAQLELERYDRLHDPEEGAELMFKLALLHSHGLRPLELFDHRPEIHTTTEPELRAMVQSDLLDNPHTLLLSVVPDMKLAADYYHAEHSGLEKAVEGKSEQLTQAAERRESWLNKMTADARSEWRSGKLAEIEVPPPIPVEVQERQDLARGLFHSSISSREVVGFDLAFDAGKLPAEILPYARIFSNALFSRFNPHLRREERQLQFAAALPEVEARLTFDQVGNDVRAYLLVFGRTTRDELSSALGHLKSVLSEPLEIGPRLSESLIENVFTTAKSEWISSPWELVASKARAGVSAVDAAYDRTVGIENLEFLRELRKRSDAEFDVSEKLLQFQRLLLHQLPSFANLSCHPENIEVVARALQGEFGFPSGAAIEKSNFDFRSDLNLKSWRHPSLSSTAVQAFDLGDLSIEERAHARVMFWVFHHRELLPVLRTGNSAYRVLCHFNADSSLATLEVSRSPKNTAKMALRMFSEVFGHAQSKAINTELVDGAKRGVVGDLDASLIREPIALAQSLVCSRMWDWNISDRLALRKAVLETTIEDIQALGKRFMASPPRSSAAIALARRGAKKS